MKFPSQQVIHTAFKIIFIVAIAIWVASYFPAQVYTLWWWLLTFKPIGYLLLLAFWIVPNYYLLVNKIFTYKNILYLLFINIAIGLISYFSNMEILILIIFLISGTIIVYYFMWMLRKNFTRRLWLLSRNIRQDIFISIFIVISTSIFPFGIIIIPAILIVFAFMILEHKKLFWKIEWNAVKQKYIFWEFFIVSLALSVFQLTTVIGFFLFVPLN